MTAVFEFGLGPEAVLRVEAGHPVELEPQISLRLKGGTFVTLQSRRG